VHSNVHASAKWTSGKEESKFDGNIQNIVKRFKITKVLWEESLKHGNYVLNRIPAAKESKSPYEIVYGKEPNLNDIHEFGKAAMVKVPDEKRKKLHDKATKMKFLGIDKMSKAYRFINSNNKIHISRDVIFLEKSDAKKILEKVKGITQEVEENTGSGGTNGKDTGIGGSTRNFEENTGNGETSQKKVIQRVEENNDNNFGSEFILTRRRSSCETPNLYGILSNVSNNEIEEEEENEIVVTAKQGRK
jgi:hypothetical protein